MKVLLLTNIPSPYMVDYLNELGKYVDLTAVFERNSSKSRDKSWESWQNKNFKSIVLKGIELGGRDSDTAICPQVIKYINRSYDRIIVCNPCTPTGIIALTYMKARRIHYGFQSEGGFPGSGIGLKEKFKKYLFSGGDFYFSTADLGDEYYMLYGAPKEKIYRYPFTSLFEKDILDKPVSHEQKRVLRAELGIPYEKMVLSVGRFLHYKGHDNLIRACKSFSDDTGIYIVGGEPPQEYISLKEQLKIDNLHFVSFKSREDITKYYMASDVFALNTRDDTWGLVINEAMAVGLPIVTTNKCYAAMAMFPEKYKHLIIDVDDVDSMHNEVEALLHDDELRMIIGRDNIEASKYFTIENMGKTVSGYLFSGTGVIEKNNK